MAILPELLIEAPMLQDALVDVSTGAPLIDGTIELFQDDARSLHKNWYYQTGTAGAYTYTALPNPMTLSAAGTTADSSGNDIIPMYYPVREIDPSTGLIDNITPQSYFVVVNNSNGQTMFTRQNFPYNPNGGNPEPPVTNSNVSNYVYNNVFWRNNGVDQGDGTFKIDVSAVTNVVIAPGLHDGFANVPSGKGGSDIQYFKNVADGSDIITFKPFLPGVFLGANNQDVTPEYYLEYACSSVGTSTSKYIQIPLTLHVKTLDAVNCTYTIWTRLNSGTGLITLSTFQFLGTGVASPLPFINKTITVVGGWTKTVVNFQTPAASASVGGGGDDALYLQIGFPVGQTFNIDIAKPSMFIGNDNTADTFENYDAINAIISSPRTGDIRTSLNSFNPFGWVPLNNGTFGSGSSGASTRANIDTFPLYELLWNLFSGFTLASAANYLPIYTSGSMATTYGASAYADFTANKQLSLPQSLGCVIAGTVPAEVSQAFTNTGNVITVTNAVPFYTGVPVTFTGGALPTGITAGIIYYAINLSTTTFSIATTYANALAGTVITLSSNASGTAITNITGTGTGQFAHLQTTWEVGSHVHAPGSGVTPAFLTEVASGGVFANTGAGTLVSTTNTTAVPSLAGQPFASIQPFNIVQPTTYYNVFLKL